LPDLTPSEVYTEEEAIKAIESSKAIIEQIKNLISILEEPEQQINLLRYNYTANNHELFSL
jgi:hypothetical protein